MQYLPFEEGIEVNGRTVWAVVDGFSAHGLLASEYLLAEGIGEKSADGMASINKGSWYSQEAWLRAFARIGDRVGDAVLFRIGLTIPSNARFPEGVKGLHEAIRSIDVAYHMNHRKNGRALYDADTRAMTEGIGHYRFEPVAGQKVILVRCRNPYPCAFDRGLITALAQMHEGTSLVEHDDSQPCRAQGADECTYRVSWR
jgi:hypothetical protein